MYIIVLAALGLALGSFVNALVWRLHEQEEYAHATSRAKRSKAKQTGAKNLSILTGRSMCTSCHHVLAAKDLVPILSWVALRGKCRYCHKPISWQYPLVELVAVLLFIASYLWWPLGFGSGLGVFSFVLWLIFITAFMALAVYDLRWFLLPDRVVYPLIGLAVIEVIAGAAVFGGGWGAVMQAAWGVLFSAGLFYLLYVLSRGKWIGFGDVKLAIVLGLLVGGPLHALLLIFVASLFGSLVAVPMLIRGKAKATTQVPFGPFLLASAVVVVLFGSNIAVWYGHLLRLP
jgi:leader peptidase (prepilin peptidase)/N-methyltransferase